MAAVIAITSGVYNAHANDISGTDIPFTEVYNRTSGNTYTATNDITFRATQLTQGLYASFISGDTTLTAGGTLVFGNHFGANTTDLVPSEEKKYDGKLNIVADNIQVAEGGYKVVLEDAKVGKKTTGGQVAVGNLSELVVLNGDISTLSDQEKKTLHAEDLVNTPTCEQRPDAQQTVTMGALAGTGNFGAYGDQGGEDAVSVDKIGTSGTRFGNVSAANTALNVAGDAYANTLVAVRSNVNAGGKVDVIGLDVDQDSVLTAAGDIDAGDTTGHVSVYGSVESTGGNVHLIHGNKSDKDGLHDGASVKAAKKATIEDIRAVLAEVEGTQGVDILNGSLVEGSTITAGSDAIDADIVVSNSTLKAHENVPTVLDSTRDITITDASEVTGTEMYADRNVIVSGGADVSDSDISAASEIVVTGHDTTMHGAVDLHDAQAVRVQDGANFAIDGGSVDAGTLAIESAKNASASVTDSSVALDTSKINAGQTLVYDGATGHIGNVVENGEGSATLKVTGGADLTAGTIDSNDIFDSYFGKVQVDGAAELDVTGNAKITDYVEDGAGTKVTFEESVSIKNAYISGTAETIAKKDAHIGNLNLATGGVMTIDNTDAKNQSYIANIINPAEGTLNVVNGTVTTPVLHDEKLVLGLNGGTVVLDTVTAEQGATIASVSPVNPHVSLDSITNAGVQAPIGKSTIRTSLHNYSYEPGTEQTADIYAYYYVARVDGTLDDGTVVHAGELVTRTDQVFTKTLHTGAVVNSGVDLTSAATLSEHDGLILDRLTQPMLDEYGEFIFGTPETLLTGQVRSLVETATYYDGVGDWITDTADGIASLTLQGDFGSDKTTINAYRVANWDDITEVWVEDTASGYINIGGDLSGSDNVLYADRDMTIGSMTGQNSNLTAQGDIVIGDIGTQGAASSHHHITATNVTTGDIYGSSSTITADESIKTGNITGDSNNLAAADIATGDITGNENILTADNIKTGNITGDSNALTAVEDIETGDITGDSNALTAGGRITAGVVAGDTNSLTAKLSVQVAGIDGNANVLESTTETVEVTGDVVGNDNVLTAAQDVTVDGNLKGDNNRLLSAEGNVMVFESVAGNANELTADGNVVVGGDVDGDNNILTSVNGDYVSVEGTVSGVGNVISAQSGSLEIGGIDGTGTIATAQEVAWVGSLSGTGTELTVYANGLSKDDTAIWIDEFNAQDTTVTIATTTSEVYGPTCGNGSIYIGAMTAVDGTVDPSMGNLIVSNNSYVEIASMDGANAYTDIVAHDYIVMGNEAGSQADTASNLTLTAADLYIASAEGVQLTDSKITVSGVIDGTSLALTTTENGKSNSSAASVSLENLTLGGNAMLTAAEAVISGTLTIDGKLATLDVTKVDTNTLVLRHNADISAARVGAENLVVEESTFAFTSIDGIQGFKIDASKGSVKQALDQLTGNVEVVNDSELYMNSDLATTAAVSVVDSALEAASITAGTSLTAENASVKSRKAITAADITAVNSTVEASSIAAENGLSVKNASTVQSGGAITAAEISVADSTLGADSIAAENSLTAENATVKANKAITAADITVGQSTIGATDIAAEDGLSIANASEVTASGAVTGTDISVADSTLGAGSIAAAAKLDVTHADVQALNGISAKDITVEESTVTATEIAAQDGLTITNASALVASGDVTGSDISVTDSSVEARNIIAEAGLDALNAKVTAREAISIKGGESDIENALVSAKQLSVDGIVNTREKALLLGHITGSGTINKTGGDALVIADADSNVDINVLDASTLKLADGTKVGAVDMGTKAAMLQLGEAGHVDTVQMDGLTLSNATDLTLDVDLDQGAADQADTATAALNGVSIKLNAMGDEDKVADQTRIAFVSGAVTSAADEDVVHGMRTLNAHADGNSVVLSKNFRSVEGLSQNQRNTAGALADLEDHMAVSGEMADVVDALHHTRSVEDTRAALDNLGGAGLAAVAKMATDDAHDHLQALRGNLKALAAGVDYRFDEQGQRIPGIQSSAISAAVTGGTTSVQEGIAPKYTRDSIGALVSGVHAITHEWLGGMSLGYNHSKGDCGPVDLKSDAIHLDVAMIRRGARVTHTATLGLGSYEIDTTRHALVNAKGHDYAGTAKGSTSAMLVDLSYEAVATVVANERHNLSGVFQADMVFGEFRGLTETGMGNAGLRSEYDDVASLNFGIGGRYTYSFGQKANPGYLAVEAMFIADAGDRDAVVKNTFLAGGQTFEEKGPDAGACGFRVNGGALIPVGQRWGVFGNVSSEFRSHQTSVSGSVGVKYAF